jgi:hypothetical protein
LTEWCSLCGNDRYYWPALKGPGISKRQATSLTAGPGDDRMDLERKNYGHNTIKKNSRRPGGDPETSKAGYAKV